MELNHKTLLSLSVLLATTGVSSLAAAGTTNLVTYTPQQIIGNAASANPSLSRGGNAVVFESDATNLIPFSTLSPNGDGNNATDIFMRVGGRTISRVSVNSLGQEAENSAFSWYNNNNFADSVNASVTADGKFVVFESNANNLDLLTADSNTTGAETDVFIRDIAKKKTYRLSGVMDAADGAITTPSLLDVAGNALTSADAPWKIVAEADDISYNPVVVGTSKSGTVAFQSDASNLLSYLVPAFPVAGNNNVYAMSLQTKKPELVNATHNTTTGVPLVEGNGNASTTSALALSQDGRFVVFASSDTNLLAGVTYSSGSDNIFIYDRKLFTMYQLSGVASTVGNGFAITIEGNNDSSNPSITGGGTGKNYLIAFESLATNMDTIPGGDTAATSDVFVVEFGPITPKDANSAYEIKQSPTGQPIRRISAPVDIATGITTIQGSRSNGINPAASTVPVIAGTSTAYTVAFQSTADNLISDPNNIYWNIDSNNKGNNAGTGGNSANTDIYVFTSKTKLFSRANVDANGQQGVSAANNPAIAPDAKGIAFDTVDQYLVPASQLNGGNTQIYLRK
jgi:hypothetical protein